MDYHSGFMIEESLSMDNVSVIALIFGFLATLRQYQRQVLFWGILGVVVLCALTIGLGATLVIETPLFLSLVPVLLWKTCGQTAVAEPA